MIDVYNVCDFDRSTDELEEFLLFGIAVAGKKAIVQAKQLSIFLQNYPNIQSPFGKIRAMMQDNTLLINLQNAKLGKYTLLSKSYADLVARELNLKTCTAEDLESVHGIGMKTSRFFLVYSRPNCQYAILDTWILKWLRSLGINAPRATPKNKNLYLRLEKLFVDYCSKHNLEISKFDLELWSTMSANNL